MKLNFTNKLKFINLILLSLLLSACDDNDNDKSNFTITPDTKIVPNSEISKYVTQEEVDSFSFRYWDIDTYEVDNNATMENFRQILKSKNTTNILNFMKDNNISVDTPLHYGVTPLMYSSFYDDENTTKELIKLGADTNATDRYKLSPIAYAIENNSTKAVKILLDSGVSIENAMNHTIQNYLTAPNYNLGLEKIIIDGDNLILHYKDNYGDRNKIGLNGSSILSYCIGKNLIEILEIIFNNGYRYINNDDFFCDINNNMDDRCSHYSSLDTIPHYEKMLDFLLYYDFPGQPTKEMMKKEYEKCYSGYISSIISAYDIENEKYFMKYETLHRNLYQKYCSDKNGKFKDIKEFIGFLNEQNKMRLLEGYIYSEKKDNLVFKNNQTEFIIKPYKELNSDEIKSIINEYYKSTKL